MKEKSASLKLIGLGVLSAVAASLCCVTPVLAIIAGSAGLASSFSWLAPARPYLIGITVIVLAFAWYRKLKPVKPSAASSEDVDCTCEEDQHPSFSKSKAFLLIITIFAILALTFPYYGKIFYPAAKKQVTVAAFKQEHVKQAELTITGMDCEACTKGIKYVLSTLPGYIDAKISYRPGKALVTFDPVKTSIAQVDSVVNSTGYEVVQHKILTAESTFHDETHRYPRRYNYILFNHL